MTFSISSGTVISNLPTGTIDSLLDVVPLSIGVTGSSPQTIRASLQQISAFQQTNVFNGAYQPSGTTANVHLSTASPRVYTASGTWTKPANLGYIIVELVGGGGGGGGVAGSASANFSASGNGGGGGEYGLKKILGVNCSGTVTVSVGAGGAGATAGNNNGSSGTASAFGSYFNAVGGQGGNGQASGDSSTPKPGSSGGGAGGTGGTGGDFYISGNPASWALCTATAVAPSKGGSSFLSGDTKTSTASNTSEAGLAAVGYGAGGGGARTVVDATNRAGGNGSNGVVIVWEYVTG